jgi:eukaryotic-like serine/threonine-protein kinase
MLNGRCERCASCPPSDSLPCASFLVPTPLERFPRPVSRSFTRVRRKLFNVAARVHQRRTRSEATRDLGVRHAREAVRARLFRGAHAPIRIGRFTVQGQLGSGAMGTVFTAHDPDLDRLVAIKVASRTDNPVAQARLRREARTMARLSHPNVVSVFEVGVHERQVFIAMERVDGVPLDRWLRDTRPSVETILGAFIQAGRGLAAAHDLGMIHRDFKPANVLVDRQGRVRVLDFGLAHAMHEAAEGNDSDAVIATDDTSMTGTWKEHVTREGVLVGTPAYMAPEQFEHQPMDARTDQFAFCVALYEALEGTRPFRGDTLLALAESICGGVPQPSRRRLPKKLRAMLERGLARDPDARHASMHTLVERLQECLETVRSQSRRRGWAGALLLAGIMASGWVIAPLVAQARSGAEDRAEAYDEDSLVGQLTPVPPSPQ